MAICHAAKAGGWDLTVPPTQTTAAERIKNAPREERTMKKTEGQQARAVKKVRVEWHEGVEDPRDRRGRRHKHHGLLNLLVASFAAGQTTLRRMEELSRDVSSLARRVLSLVNRVSDTTLYMLLASQKVAGLRET